MLNDRSLPYNLVWGLLLWGLIGSNWGLAGGLIGILWGLMFGYLIWEYQPEQRQVRSQMTMTTPEDTITEASELIIQPVEVGANSITLEHNWDPLQCVKEATAKMQELLKESCELPLEKLAELAADHGVKPHEILALADKSETCFIDYTTGHVRCKEEEG